MTVSPSFWHYGIKGGSSGFLESIWVAKNLNNIKWDIKPLFGPNILISIGRVRICQNDTRKR